jgi:hypothetical protein
MTHYRGSCHCGAIQFEIDAEITSVYKCDCSLCRKKNALMAPVHESKFKLTAGADKLALYQWNTRVARHHFCTVCGIYPFHRKRTAPDEYAVNVYCLGGFNPDGLPVVQARGSTLSVTD